MEGKSLALALKNLSKKEIQQRAKVQGESDVEGGFVNVIDVIDTLKKIETFSDSYVEQVKPAVINELRKYPEFVSRKSVQIKGTTFTISTNSQYDYSADPVWQELNAKLKAAKAALSSREAYLKTLLNKDVKPNSELDEDSGEVIKAVPPSLSQSDVLKIQF